MAQPATTLPRLESGDRLSREEFHRRYELRPDIHKAELIDGVVYVPSPAKLNHSRPQILAVTWVGNYMARHPQEVDGADNGTLRLANGDDEVQPDVALWRIDSGRVVYDDDGYVSGAPELILEIANTSAGYDLGAKKRAYESAGVVEYMVWDTAKGEVHWFRLGDGKYVTVEADADGAIESVTFPGLVLNVRELLASLKGPDTNG